MRLNTTMPKPIRPYFQKELTAYHSSLLTNDFQEAWLHLERAHVIGQSYPFEHTLVHWRMLQFGTRIKSFKEIIGQIPRLLVGGVKSFIGKIPVGNTGGANIPPLKSLPIEPDIIEIFERAGVSLRK